MTPYQLLRTKYPENECVLIREVSDSTARHRSLDFMVINLWESRGLSVIGIEVKSYRGDWLNELKNPAKQELHAPYCDFFYLFTTDEKVAKLEEIPENWGWMTERGGKIFILKKAPKLKAEPIPKKLMIGMIRRAADKSDFIHKDSIKEEIQKKIDNALERRIADNQREIERLKYKYDEMAESVKAFEDAFGMPFPIHSWTIAKPKKIGEALKFVLNNDISVMYEKLKDIQGSTQKLLDKANQSIQDYENLNNEEESNTIC